jgi:elongation factor Ts
MVNFIDNVKKLREVTGIGIVECRNALMATYNNFDDAILYLRKKSSSVVAMKSTRVANEGLIFVKVSDNKKCSVMLELNCETDFVSKSCDFQGYGEKLCDFFLSDFFGNDNFLLFGDDVKLSSELMDLLANLVSKFGENIVVKRVFRNFVNDGFVFSYTHFGRIGAVLHISINDYDVALPVLMQIASMNPRYVAIKDVPEDFLINEKVLYFEKLKDQYPDKDISLLNKMVDGQLSKFFKENVLLEQSFIKDLKNTVKFFLRDCVVYSFIRFETGENFN